jgi:uncharacterized small protein (DUF1192 family)
MRDFSKAAQSAEFQHPNIDNPTLSKLKSASNQLTREIKLHDLEMKKMALGAQAAQAELSYYDSIGEKTQNSIANVREEIEKLRADLAQETKVRKNREEYEALAKMASDREPSRDTKRKLEVIHSEMEKIRNDTDKRQRKLDVKGKQFHLLSQCIADLKNGLEEDKIRAQVEKAAKQNVSSEGGGS